MWLMSIQIISNLGMESDSQVTHKYVSANSEKSNACVHTKEVYYSASIDNNAIKISRILLMTPTRVLY